MLQLLGPAWLVVGGMGVQHHLYRQLRMRIFDRHKKLMGAFHRGSQIVGPVKNQEGLVNALLA